MSNMLAHLHGWFFGLGAQYGVDPIMFGAIYVGAIPFFTASVALVVRNLRRGTSIALPALAAGFFFVSAYLYLIIAGKNIPVWVYGFIAVLVVGGAWSAVRKIRARAAAPDDQAMSSSTSSSVKRPDRP